MQQAAELLLTMRGGGGRNINLRRATHAENSRNARKRHYKELPLGVFLTRQGKFQAKLAGAGVRIALGVFLDENDAARAYDRAAVKHYGEFAKLNFARTE